jgi:hypothetical protein
MELGIALGSALGSVLGAEEEIPLDKVEGSVLSFDEGAELGLPNGDEYVPELGSIVGLQLSVSLGLFVGSTLGCLQGI